jgi:hypothetical protein
MADHDPDFEAIFMSSGIGSPSLGCGCGRQHYSSTSPFIEAEELEDLRKRAKAKPDRYVDHADDDGVSSVRILGREYVRGCECDYPAKAAELLWSYGPEIVKYLTLRNGRKAREVLEMVNALSDYSATEPQETPPPPRMAIDEL